MKTDRSKKMNLTKEEVRMLAESERMMDSGEMSFVVFGGNRMIVADEVMESLGLQHGQSINWEIFGAIQEKNICRIQFEKDVLYESCKEIDKQ